MSEAERRRAAVFAQVRDEQMTLSAAAVALGVSERQAWRLKRRYADGGDGGLVHKLRGRASNRRADEASRSAVLALCREKYAGVGPDAGVRVPGAGGQVGGEPRHAGPLAAGRGAGGAAASAGQAPEPAAAAGAVRGAVADGRELARLVRRPRAVVLPDGAGGRRDRAGVGEVRRAGDAGGVVRRVRPVRGGARAAGGVGRGPGGDVPAGRSTGTGGRRSSGGRWRRWAWG